MQPKIFAVRVDLSKVMSTCFSLQAQIKMLKDPSTATVSEQVKLALATVQEYIGAPIPLDILLEAVIPFVQDCADQEVQGQKLVEVLEHLEEMDKHGVGPDNIHLH